ncbi:IclR family transcriptional regulator [Phyllobacterium sp. 0TCS1.6C]|uniref:IclR family transcriptional regulator n=1 Tax=unclassified Phyllobacterium TaxID=2638441 RepID=UPI002263B0B4|nr:MULTISPECIES: IclR family transcriptional regulator [unclassified Phyllobacterium]MCX8279826.1 IclR family transcriptional regulator [Phyllobacterium sp. 0TCS1.6C]MCX8295570.1 IclR family transcriptional regulator [Phyllobacterium sp. 0TCS1.6A]
MKTAPKPAARAETGTLGKAVDVLDIVARADTPLRFTDILQLADQPRGTLHRQIANLLEEGLLVLNSDNSYGLGMRLMQLAAKAWSRNDLRLIAAPHLQKLHEATGETVHLGVLRGVDVVYLDKIESRQSVRMVSQIGNTAPAYCTGVGKAALSALPEAELDALVKQIRFRFYTSQTLMDKMALYRHLKEVRERGVAFDRQEHEVGIACVAAPIHLSNGAAGISVTGPSYRLTWQVLASYVEVTRKAAAAIMDDLAAGLAPRS